MFKVIVDNYLYFFIAGFTVEFFINNESHKIWIIMDTAQVFIKLNWILFITILLDDTSLPALVCHEFGVTLVYSLA